MIQSRINDLEPGKLRAYNELINRQREMHERCVNAEARLNEVVSRIRHLESDEKNNSHRKEYASLEKQFTSLLKDNEALKEELEITNLPPKEAHQKFVERVNQHKQKAAAAGERINSLNEENERLRRVLEQVDNSEEDQGEAAKYELLVKRDQDMTAFIDKFDESRDSILSEQRTVKDTIVAVLEHIGRNIDETSNMPSQDALGEMKDAKSFKEKNLATAEKTMETLQVE